MKMLVKLAVVLVVAVAWVPSHASAQDNASPEAANPEAAQALAGPSDYAQIARFCRGRAPSGTSIPPLALTPVNLRVIQPIVPVPATDGFIHLAFAAVATSVSKATATIASITPIDPLTGLATGTNSVLDGDGTDITGKIRLFNPNLLRLVDGPHAETATDFTQMPGGSAGTTFFDVRYNRASDLPRLVALQIAIKFADPSQPPSLTLPTDPIVVSCDPPPVLRPPLVGSNWWNGNGCCEIVGPHRGATLPINGDVHAPESFAIDYVQLTSSNGCCTGPIHDLASWPFYGAPILAAANGTIVEIEDGLPEQIPAQDPVDVTVTNAAGNHIIEQIQGGRYFILYAHLKTGSIDKGLRVGSRLRAGEQIGELGNSGSSTAPHLHFQVMDRPSTLDAAGLPFVFTSQQLQGRVIGSLNAASSAYESGQPVTVDRGITGWQAFRMPAETQVFGYNLK